MATFVKRHLRRGQTITTFGPGSIVDLRDESVMMGGLDFWPKNSVHEIHEPNLERVLGVDAFRMPSTIEESGNGKDLPYVIFPRWLSCPNCHRLAPFELFAGGMAKPGSTLKCPDCRKKVFPARLIVACVHGHIDDFPWVEWIRRGSKPCTCVRPALELVSSGRTASLGDLIVKCKNKDCGGQRSLSGATEAKNLKFMKCSGNRPWLADKQPCEEGVIPLQRGASNVYFPLISSALSIPPWSRSIQTVLNPYWSTLQHIPDIALEPTIVGMNLPARVGLTASEIVQAIKERKMSSSTEGIQTISEVDLRQREYSALSKSQTNNNLLDDFKTREAEIHPSISNYFSKIVLVDRLREVRALLGFSRISPPDPDPQTRLGVTLTPLARNRKNWLPAIEVYGEGIFLEFSSHALSVWKKKHGKVIETRSSILHSNYVEMCNRRNWNATRVISPELLLIHSFAHVMIRQLSLDSGYSSAALRERLYIFEPSDENGQEISAGVLIYTSSPDSEGSLGGLVRQGESERLALTVRSAINEATWCSSDPLCIESEGQGHDALNLSACHACLLLSETCCEEYNRLLDRAMLIGTLENPESGFFKELVEI